MKEIWLGDTSHGALIAHAAGVGFDPEIDQVISRVDNGFLLGGFIFTNYSKVAIQVHAAGFRRGWLSRELLCLSFDYPFSQLHVDQILATAGSNKPENLDMFTRAGYVEVARIPDAIEGGDLLILSMSRGRCKWLTLASRYIQRASARRELVA